MIEWFGNWLTKPMSILDLLGSFIVAVVIYVCWCFFDDWLRNR